MTDVSHRLLLALSLRWQAPVQTANIIKLALPPAAAVLEEVKNTTALAL
jgi:hypothetical protein